MGVWLEVQFNTWNREFYNTFEIEGPGGVLPPARHLHDARGALHRQRRLPPVLPADADDRVAHLDDRALSRRLAEGPRLLPPAAARQGHGQPRPADRRRPERLRRPDADARARPALGGGDAGVLHRHPVGHLGRGDVLRHRDPGLHGLGRAALRDRGHLAHAPDRPAAGRHQLQHAARRGGFPLFAGAPARERRGRGAVPRRGGRAGQLPRALRRRDLGLVDEDATSRSSSAGSSRSTARWRSSFRSWSPRRAFSPAPCRWAASSRSPPPSARCRARCPGSSTPTAATPTGRRPWTASPASREALQRAREEADRLDGDRLEGAARSAGAGAARARAAAGQAAARDDHARH